MSSAEPIRPRLLALLSEARTALQAWSDTLSDAERAMDGTPDRWAPKDIVAHLTSWRVISLGRVEAVLRGEQLRGEEAVQAHNETTFEREHQRPWDDLVAESDRLFEAQRTAVAALSEAQLADTSYPWLDGFPFSASVAGTFEHTIEHLVNLSRERGDWPQVEQLLARQAQGLCSLDDSPTMRAYVSYSQGSYWASLGRPDHAIPLLREAFALDAAHAEDARQNASLDPIRDLPEFQAILPTPSA